MDDERKKTSLTLPKQLWKDFQKRCIDLELNNTDALGAAMQQWLEKHPAPAEQPRRAKVANLK